MNRVRSIARGRDRNLQNLWRQHMHRNAEQLNGREGYWDGNDLCLCSTLLRRWKGQVMQASVECVRAWACAWAWRLITTISETSTTPKLWLYTFGITHTNSFALPSHNNNKLFHSPITKGWVMDLIKIKQI